MIHLRGEIAGGVVAGVKEWMRMTITASGGGVIWTLGHSTRPLPLFMELLRGVGVTLLVDVRMVPRSRHNPQFNRESLPGALAEAGITYRHEVALGGLRKPVPDSLNTAWRNTGFRGFADYMQTPEFEEAVAGLEQVVGRARAVLMCAEAVPWRCHRSLIADALLARGVEVRHLLGPGREQRHEMTPFARVEDGRVIYPGLL